MIAGTAVASAIAPAWATGTTRTDKPHDVGRKFFADGRVMPFAGNTIICHLPQQGEGSEAFRAMLDIYRQLPAMPFARKMTALPPSSYHMTVIGGANDKDRRRPLWPADMPLDASMQACNDFVGDRLRDFALGDDAAPYRMKVNLAEPAAGEEPLTIRLLPADADTATKLYRLRRRLANRMGIGIENPDDYGFHMTMGYAVDWLTTLENHAFRVTLAEWKKELAHRAPVITFGAPEYCLLDDMFHFARQFYLR
ncbi:DUF1868 domain-containing protein [Novosphingobium sp.]|uniref:DUF1868 domain-containing protein n=1 Tax=Novosphingobium sp. TaxID=1874826 RepID=UPI0028AE3EDD|nr:DUF1868 domain-containing protein [Novosphingobium sp.]